MGLPLPSKRIEAVLGFAILVFFFLFSLAMLLSFLNHPASIEALAIWLALTFLWAYGAYRYWKTRDFDEAFSWFGNEGA